jgi:hypothetical protein
MNTPRQEPELASFDHFFETLNCWLWAPAAILLFKQMILTATKIRQITLNLPDFFLSFLDEPVILSVTDQRRDTKKGSGGVAGEKGSSVRRPFYPLTGPLKNFYGVPSLSAG